MYLVILFIFNFLEEIDFLAFQHLINVENICGVSGFKTGKIIKFQT